MVNQHPDILQAIQSGETTSVNSAVLEDLIRQYPYFQALWAIKTKHLKSNGYSFGITLQQTAAHTIDRKQLFEYVNPKPKKKFTFKKKTISKPEPDKKNTQNPADTGVVVFIKEKDANKQNPATNPDLKPSTLKEEKTVPDEKSKKSYLEWLQEFKNIQTKTPPPNKTFDIIDKFLKERPKIVPKKNVSVKPPDIIEKSIVEKQMLMTETLANLYVKQKKYDKAIQAFRILSLKYPKKSSYFANQIKEIKQNLK